MSFGTYFKKLRKAKGITQESVAVAIGKSKMLVSGVESGKNGAFIEADLWKISKCLSLNEEEKSALFAQASIARKCFPDYMMKYIAKHDDVYRLLEMISEYNLDTNHIKEIQRYVEETHNAKDY